MWQMILFVLVTAFAVFVQSVAGFGGTLLSMPLGILLVGVGVARPVLTIVAWITGIVMAIAGWRQINWKELIKMTLVMLVGVLLGIWLFNNLSLSFLLVLYGVMIILIGLKKLLRPSSRTLPAPLQWGALTIAGLMQGLFVSGGSFLVIYAMARIKEKQVFRPTINLVWALLNTVLVVNYFLSGQLSGSVLSASGICLVPTFLAMAAGAALAKRINQAVFLKIVNLILIVSGAVLVISNI